MEGEREREGRGEMGNDLFIFSLTHIHKQLFVQCFLN